MAARQTAAAEPAKELGTSNKRSKPQKKSTKKYKDVQKQKAKKLVSGICYVHTKFGKNARKCALPKECLWPQN